MHAPSTVSRSPDPGDGRIEIVRMMLSCVRNVTAFLHQRRHQDLR